jgi:hypothetical protein
MGQVSNPMQIALLALCYVAMRQHREFAEVSICCLYCPPRLCKVACFVLVHITPVHKTPPELHCIDPVTPQVSFQACFVGVQPSKLDVWCFPVRLSPLRVYIHSGVRFSRVPCCSTVSLFQQERAYAASCSGHRQQTPACMHHAVHMLDKPLSAYTFDFETHEHARHRITSWQVLG